MKNYIGAITVKAEPAWNLIGRDGHEHVVTDQPTCLEGETVLEGYLVLFGDGHHTWLSKEFFETAYYPTDGMNFGLAIEAAKQGARIARKGWNGKAMYVFLAYEADFVTDADISAYDQLEVEVGDMLVMKTAQDTFQPGWLASQADMLAEDWFIVE